MLLLGVLQAQAAGAGPVGGAAFDLLEQRVLDSAESSVTFSSLSSYAASYAHLQIRFAARAARAGQVGDPVVIKINTATVPISHHLFGNGSSVTSSAPINYTIIDSIAGASAAANQFGVGVIDFTDAFSTDKNKTMRALAGGVGAISLSSALWTSTAITDSIEFIPFSLTNLQIGSRVSLYGYGKGA